MKEIFTQGRFLGSKSFSCGLPAQVFGILVFFLAPLFAQAQVPQNLPFSQNWSNTGLITVNDDWFGVPGIVGFRGDNLTGGTGTDPQTLLQDDVSSPVDVNANQANPSTNSAGGVTEFDGINNPVVALQGSGTADAPYLLIAINTSGLANINVAYNVRDIDSSSDNSIQQVALQYRIGNTGDFTNIPAGYIADATTGPSQNFLVTAVNVTLPANAENQPVVQLRIMTTNAVGNDEWVGIDDINITGQQGGNGCAPDVEAPTFNLPLPVDVTISCEENIPPMAMLTASDNCDSSVIVLPASSIVLGDCPQEFFIFRSWTATDDAGNSTVVAQTVTIVDNTAPVFNQPLPADITLACDASLPLPPTVTAQDACDPGQVPPVIFINEIHYDNIGTDANEFIEVAGTAGLDLSQYALVLYNGNGGVEYGTTNLTGTIDNEGAGFGAVSFAYPVNGIQNGSPDGVALIRLPNTVVQFLSYEGPFMAANGPAAGMMSQDIGVLETGADPIGNSLQLTGAGQVYGDFSWTGPVAESPGTLNAGQSISALPGTITAVLTETSMMGDCPGEMIYKRMWTATDACGNSTTHMQTITLQDLVAPAFVPPLPQNITINCDAPVPPPANLLAVDNCDTGAGMNEVWINEIHYDNVGTDVNEFLEVAGTSGTDLSAYSLFLYNGNGGGTYGSMTLSGVIDNESNGFGAISFPYPVNGLQNGSPDGLALVHNGMVVQFLSYEGTFMAVGGPANGMTSTDIGVSENGSNPVGTSLQLIGTGTQYSDFSWTGPVADSPGSINAGQSFNLVPVGLQVDFSETSVAGNCPNAQTITRTWTVEDGCGNGTSHVQVISVVDVTPPVVSCQNITVNLDLDGTVTVNQSNFSYTATDNCPGPLTLLPNSVTVTCANAGSSVPFVLSVRDTCGNVGTCTAQIIVPAFDRCVPEISIADPCVCKNNATNLTNGQFEDRIYIKSLTGKTWAVTQVTGLFRANSPAPPAAPLPVSPGTLFTEIPVGSGDYFLTGIHVDAIGYSITVQSLQGEVLTIGNQCAYPNPTVSSDLSGPFCLYSDPVPLVGDPGDANFVSAEFTVNGVPATTFDPGMGIGQYIIRYTVDGGVPKAFGPNDPGCIYAIQYIVNVIATPSDLACNNLVQISLDEDCSTEVTPDMILEGSYGCFDDYTVTITTMNGSTNYGNTVTGANIGQVLKATVKHLESGNTCWGTITVEDKLAPKLTCADLELSCVVMNYTPDYLANVLNVAGAFPDVDENCSDYDLYHADTWFDLGCSGSFNGMQDLSAYVRRVWTAVDGSGNQSTCTQFLYFKRRHVQDVQLPPDVTVSCVNPNTSPANTGMPYLMEFGLQFGLFPNNTYCELQTVYADQILPVCDGTYKILRTWTVYDWCLPTNPTPPDPNPVYWIQVIKVEDATAPVVQCPQNITVGINPFECVKDLDLPDVLIEDACSRIASIRAEYVLGGITYTVNGTLSDFPGNNLWTPDTLGVLGYANDLPLGTTAMRYIVTDDCGNSTVCSFNVTVVDNAPPVAVCDEFTQVSLGISGEVLVNATTFDDGSYDNCAAVSFKARRMSSNGCQSASSFHDQVRFCCDDIGDTITVVFRVYDVPVPAGSVSLTLQEARSNDCMVQVFVDDKIKPVCQAPAHVTVSCENFDPSLWAYGAATAADNCCIDTITTTVNYSLFDTLCNKGTITRTFRAFDCYNNSSQCTQRIVVNYEQDYYIRFPNDVIVTECNGSGMYGEPSFFGEDCELLAVSFEDEVFTVVPDACYKIERTWTITNWCTYDPNGSCIVVPNPNPNATSNHPSNLPGPVVSAPGTLAPWAPTIVKVNPTDPVATNYAVFWDANANCYKYKQIIKVIDTDGPELNCDAVPLMICNNLPNNPNFWNASYWYDSVHGLHDLCETDTDVTIVGTDSCSGSDINIRYILFLDLDGDGTMETAISSTNPPPAGSVYYNNAFNPNFSGGELREFDQRPVPANQKYRFTIQSVVNGNLKTTSVRWNTAQSPNAYISPLLPNGTHKIKWIASDGCGNETVCEKEIIVEDCKPPSVVCLNGLSVNIMPTGMITLWASDFLQYAEDNCTPANQLDIAVIKSGQSNGLFPVDFQGNPITSVNFDCSELGSQLVQLWARDKAGNADYCETYVIVQDNMGNCGASPITIAGALQTELQDGVEEVSVDLSASHPATPPISMFDITDPQGAYFFGFALPNGANYTLTPLKDDNHLNGVTTYDLVLISKHILGLEPLNSPYKMIAADANKSKSITTFDIVELRKLILGIYNELPNNTSWRFVDKGFVFTDPINPFLDNFPETISVADVQDSQLAEDFVGIKVGDVNNTVIPNGLLSADDRTTGTLLFDVEDREVKAGEEFALRFKAAEQVEGYQFTLNYTNLEVVDIVPGAEMKADNFGVFADAITTSFDGAATGEFTVQLRAKADGRISNMVGISSRITKAEAYSNDSRLDVALRFNGTTIAGVGFELYQNTPNPFINKTMVGFHLPEPTEATLTVYDETGRMIFTQTGDFGKGYNAITIDRAMLNTTGMLYYKLETATDSATRKMIGVK